MLIKIVYWIIICGDVAALLLLFVLGLAAAPSSRTSPLAVAAFMLVIPGLLIALSILLFLRGTSPLWRGAAFLLAASPIILVVSQRGIEEVKLRANSDSQGNMTYFRAGPLRDIATAIARNDAETVARLAPQVDVNSGGYGDTTLLLNALRQLRQTPGQLDVLRALMKAGADPNKGADELPLELALQVTSRTGPEPVMLLLAAGAKPNTKNQFGTPVYFGAIGSTTGTDLLKAFLDHGADLNAQGRQGRNVVAAAATTSNWKAVLFLIQRGADWKSFRTLDGRGFKDML
ncbi:MAG: hypothetical protein ABIZ80_07460, partial [Bryobacteraceae bacterium]